VCSNETTIEHSVAAHDILVQFEVHIIQVCNFKFKLKGRSRIESGRRFDREENNRQLDMTPQVHAIMKLDTRI
jgi:hypothetical protein